MNISSGLKDSDKINRTALFFLIFFTVLAGGIIVFDWEVGQTEAEIISGDFTVDFYGKSTAITQDNTLLPISNPSDPELKVVKKIQVIVTAYSSTPWETDDDPFVTAAGTKVREGVVANNLLSFGTKIKIPEIYGDKIFIVEDRMNWNKGYYHFDIWFPSYWEAKDFGVKRTYVEVLEG